MSSFLIQNVLVFDGFDIQSSSRTVLVSDGLIQYIGAENSIDAPKNVEIIDGSGLTLLPGLIDAHVHVFRGEEEMRLAIEAGITTVFDCFNTPANGLYMKEKSQTSQDFPQIFTTLHAATIDGGWPRAVVRHTNTDPVVLDAIKDYPKLDSVQSAKDYVRHNKLLGADFIKLMQESGQGLTFGDLPAPTKELQQAVINAAHENGLFTLAHATNLRETLLVLDAGVDGMAHQFFDQPHNQRLLDAYKRTNAFVIPTLTAISSMMGLSTSKEWASSRDLPDLSRRTICDCMKISKPGCSVQFAYDCIKALKSNNIDIICGTDSGPSIHGTALGSAIHLELSLYVKYCNFTPTEALRSATGLSAKRLRLDDRGSIQIGKRADLLLVRGNPATSIDETMNVDRVWKNGELCYHGS